MLATGAGVALTSHVLKSGTRALLNTSPEPVSNWTASVTEDVAVVGGLALAFAHPFIALAIVVAMSALLAMAVWWVWRRVRRALFGPRPPAAATNFAIEARVTLIQASGRRAAVFRAKR
jgi:hypothetical protein